MVWTTRLSDRYFFWTGNSTLHTAIGTWQRSLQRLFKLAGIENGYAHRFRDTFSVELLLAGVPIEQVSVLIGHSGSKITSMHYSPWVRSRQEQLAKDLHPVTSGTDGKCPPSLAGSYLCTAGTGQFGTYSGPTGWGTPNGIGAF